MLMEIWLLKTWVIRLEVFCKFVEDGSRWTCLLFVTARNCLGHFTELLTIVAEIVLVYTHSSFKHLGLVVEKINYDLVPIKRCKPNSENRPSKDHKWRKNCVKTCGTHNTVLLMQHFDKHRIVPLFKVSNKS